MWSRVICVVARALPGAPRLSPEPAVPLRSPHIRLDRTAVGVFVANLMRLPKAFPRLTFSIDYAPLKGTGGAEAVAAERVLRA